MSRATDMIAEMLRTKPGEGASDQQRADWFEFKARTFEAMAAESTPDRAADFRAAARARSAAAEYAALAATAPPR